MADPNDQRSAIPSLLSLQPANSGTIWNQMMAGSSILMPVSQPLETREGNDSETDSFVCQGGPKAGVGGFQPVRSGAPTPPPVTSTCLVSQLQQPLRPVQSRHTPSPQHEFQPPPGPQTQSQSGFLRGHSPASMVGPPPPGTLSGPPLSGSMAGPPSMAPMAGPPPMGNISSMSTGPPIGPSQNFRRQGPLQHTYAPTPGLSHPGPTNPGYPGSTNPGMGHPGTTNPGMVHPGPTNPGMGHSVSTNPGMGHPGPMVSAMGLPDLINTGMGHPGVMSSGMGHSHGPPPETTSPPSYAQPYQVPIYQPPQQAMNLQEDTPHQWNQGPVLNKGAESPTLVLGPSSETFRPVQYHWFYQREVEKKHIWLPFSIIDSLSLEEAFKKGDYNAVVTTDGGRYDVTVGERIRRPVYWEEEPSPVKRSSWFFKADGQNRFVPYEEDMAERIEEHYRDAVVNNRLHHRLELPGHESIVVHNPQLVAHYQPSKHTDEWGTVVDGQMRTRVVKRGINEILKVEEGEPSRIDHLVFMVHGVGPVCDLRFRNLVECVDDFRSMSLSLVRTHFKDAQDQGRVGRVEFLPVSWHESLHSDGTGIDKRMQSITLTSIPKLRHFTNDTLMDIFFFTSPVYCQTIVDTVGLEINRLHQIFMNRNPDFSGRISLAGHSLGSLILFDILAHQLDPERPLTPPSEPEPPETAPEENIVDSLEAIFQTLDLQEYLGKFQEEKLDLDTLKICTDSDLKEIGLPLGSRKKLFTYLKELEVKQTKCQEKKELERIPCSQSKMSLLNRQESITSVNYMVGVAGTGQPSVVYPKLPFQPSGMFALGSPIAVFLTVRGIQNIGEDYHLPTCPSFFNIFHPFDPVAYRIETLIDPELQLKPILIPHHKGRKRMHLELRDSLSRMGTDIKQRLVDSIRNTWQSLSEFARAHISSAEQLEAEVDRVVSEELLAHQGDNDDTESNISGADSCSQEDIQIGQLNGGRRIDYVLQEKPIESFNEYLFALASHACYWESEDTALMILKEIYRLDGIVPQSPSTQASRPLLYNPAARDLYNISPLNSDQSVPFLGAMNSGEPCAHPPLKGFVPVSPLIRR